MRAVGYFRPSSEPGEAGDAPPGPESSLSAIERYCRENFHQLVRVVEASGPEGRYDELLAFFDGPEGAAALVLIPDSAHLADDLPTLVERLIQLEAAGGEARCVDPDLPDPLQNGLANLGVRGRAPERLRRVREAIGAKAVRGEVLGRTPYGYRAGLDGRLTQQPEEAETVRRIFGWYAGDVNEGADGVEEERPAHAGPGLRRIAARLNEEGVRTRSGNPWTPVAVAGVLRNRVYVGTYSRLGLRLVGSHPGLVDRAVFNRAQEIVRQRRPRRRRTHPERYLLGGLLRCAVCGRGVFGLTRKRTWRRKDGTEVSRAYRYYECPGRAVRSGGAGAGEEHPSWRAQRLEEAVRGRIAAWARSVPGGARVAAPEAGSVVRRRRSAERLFMRSVREVASGVGMLGDLAGPLAQVRLAQAESGAGDDEEDAEVRALVADALAEETGVAGGAIARLVRRVVVRSNSVEVVMRPWSVGGVS